MCIMLIFISSKIGKLRVHQGYQNINIKKPVITTGVFDGVHLGHKLVLQQVIDKAAAIGGSSVLITYWPHPKWVHSKSALSLLTTIDEKTKILEEIGLDHLVIIPFTKEFSQTSGDDFVKEVLVDNLKVSELLVGHDHKYGRNSEGGFEHLQELAITYGFNVGQIAPYEKSDTVVSSSKIRSLLELGKVRDASRLLGYNYSLSGTVVRGNQIGRNIGYPTANIKPKETYKLLPTNGVYAVRVSVQETLHNGMLYIGPRPTIEEFGKEQRIEVNLFDFNQDIYDAEIEIEFFSYIRGDVKFDGLAALKKQLGEDEMKVKRRLS